MYIYIYPLSSLEKLLSLKLIFEKLNSSKTARMKTKQLKPGREYSKHASQSSQNYERPLGN